MDTKLVENESSAQNKVQPQEESENPYENPYAEHTNSQEPRGEQPVDDNPYMTKKEEEEEKIDDEFVELVVEKKLIDQKPNSQPAAEINGDDFNDFVEFTPNEIEGCDFIENKDKEEGQNNSQNDQKSQESSNQSIGEIIQGSSLGWMGDNFFYAKEKLKENVNYHKQKAKENNEYIRSQYNLNKDYLKSKIKENTEYYSDQLGVVSEAMKYPTLRRLIQEKLGYPLEKHIYTTEDGYINTVYRIPGYKGQKPGLYRKTKNRQRPVIIYQHGLLDCCAGIICDEEESLGLRLVNKGFDLWMNNSRGNKYSRDHSYIDLDTCSKEENDNYFSFSFSEMATYDQPALWEYVIGVTGAEQITYIGHSQGTTQMFASIIENKEFFKKHMKRFVAMAPCVRVKNMRNKLIRSYFEHNDANVEYVKKKFGQECLTTASNFNFLANMIIGSKFGGSTSNQIIEMISDENAKAISARGYMNNTKFYPAGSTQNQFLHFLQLLREGEFKKFDHKDPEKNMLAYGSEEPPLYDLQQISGFKITMICGKGDLLVSPDDYEWLSQELHDAGNFINFQEYDVGHMGMVFPADKSITKNIFDTIVADFPVESYEKFAKPIIKPIVEIIKEVEFEHFEKIGIQKMKQNGQPMQQSPKTPNE